MIDEVRDPSRIRWGWLPAFRDESDAMAGDVWCKLMGAEAGDRAARAHEHALFERLEGIEPKRVSDIMDAVGQMVMSATYAAASVAVTGTQHGATPRTAQPDELERTLARLVRQAVIGHDEFVILDLQRLAVLEREYQAFMDRCSADAVETTP